MTDGTDHACAWTKTLSQKSVSKTQFETRCPRRAEAIETIDRSLKAGHQPGRTRQVPLTCRGFQILNVVCGGMLLQDIPTPQYQQHAAKDGVSAVHAIELTDGSRLHSLLAKSPIAVNSRHHQAVTRKTLGCPLVATACSSGEDIVEGIEKPGKAWVVGVQWHPERIEDNIGDSFQVLFRDFIRAAAEKSGPK